ncbi:MAG: hypothetical protein ACREEE_03345 [Dongiaceae bacterium]
MGIETYDPTPGQNTALFPEGMAPSAVNDGMRQVQADIRNWYNTAEWVQYGDGDKNFTVFFASATSFTVAGVDVTAIYHAGRRVKATGSLTGTIHGTISSSSFSTNTTVNVTWDSGSLQNEALIISIGIVASANSSAPRGAAQFASQAETEAGTLSTKSVTPAALKPAAMNWTGVHAHVGKSVEMAKGANIASAATTNIWATDGNTVHITGTTAITSFGTAPQAGAWRWLIFDGVLTLTHGANLDLPGAANIVTAVCDRALVIADTTTAHLVAAYMKDNGAPIALGDLDGLTLVNNPASSAFVAGSTGAASNRKFRVGEVGGWCALEEQVASNSASLDFVLTPYLPDFEDFEFIISDLQPTTDAVHLWLRTSSNGGVSYDSGASDYAWTNMYHNPGVVSGDNDQADAQISLTGNSATTSTSNVAGETYNAVITILSPATAVPTHVGTVVQGYTTSDGQMTVVHGSARRLASADVDAVRFLMSAGTIASGKITLIGRRKVN